MPPSNDPAIARVWFAPKDTSYFYWLIPESPTTAVVGLAHSEAHESRPKLDRFLQDRGLEPTSYEAARIPMYERAPAPWGRIGHASVYLVGDAAGQVKVTTVGGTVTGFRGARAAARSILRHTSYQHELRRLNRELDLHCLLRWLLNRFEDDDYSELIRSLNARVRALLHTRDRDRLAGGFWSLLACQPRLLLVAGPAVAMTR